MPMKPKTTLSPCNFTDLAKSNANIYETVVVIAKRAKQVAVKVKEELDDKLAEFISPLDNLEEVFENKEHIEISKSYEKKPKPVTIATEEFLADKLMYRYPDLEALSE